jgi:hypothetical protein
LRALLAPAGRGVIRARWLGGAALPVEVLVNEKQLAKLIRQTTAKAEKLAAKRQPSRAYDATLSTRDENAEDVETTRLFQEMKKREF